MAMTKAARRSRQVKTWTPKSAQRRSLTELQKAETAIQKCAYEWGDINQTLVELCDEAVQHLEEIRVVIEYEASGRRAQEEGDCA
jgi:hypothetical protein